MSRFDGEMNQITYFFERGYFLDRLVRNWTQPGLNWILHRFNRKSRRDAAVLTLPQLCQNHLPLSVPIGKMKVTIPALKLLNRFKWWLIVPH